MPEEAMPTGPWGRLSYTIRAPSSGAKVEVLLSGRGPFKVKAVGPRAAIAGFDAKKGKTFPMHPDGVAATWAKVKQLVDWS